MESLNGMQFYRQLNPFKGNVLGWKVNIRANGWEKIEIKFQLKVSSLSFHKVVERTTQLLDDFDSERVKQKKKFIHFHNVALFSTFVWQFLSSYNVFNQMRAWKNENKNFLKVLWGFFSFFFSTTCMLNIWNVKWG